MKKRDIWRFAVVMVGILCMGFSSAQGQDERRQRLRRPGVEKQAGERQKARAEAVKARFLEELSRDDRRPMDPDRRRALLRRFLQQRGGDQQGARRGQGRGFGRRFQNQKDADRPRARAPVNRRQAQGGLLPERLREQLKERASKGQIDPERMKAILARIARNHPEAARLLKQRLNQRQGDASARRPRGGAESAQPPLRGDKAPRAQKAPATPEEAAKRIQAMEKRIQALKKRLEEAKKAAGSDG